MKLNRFCFNEEYAYTYREVIEKVLREEYLFFGKDSLCQFLAEQGYIELNAQNTGVQTNLGAYSFIDGTGTFEDQVSKNAIDVLNKVALRYQDHFAVVSDTDDNDEVRGKSCQFFTKVVNVLDYTFKKYDTLLNVYSSQERHLLDRLKKNRVGETTDVLEGEHSITRVRDEDKSNSASGQHYNTRVLDEDKTSTLEGEHSITKGTSVSSESESGSQNASSDTPQTINGTGDFDAINGYYNKYDKAHDSATTSSEGSESDEGTNSESGSATTDATETDNGSTSSSGTENIDVEETDNGTNSSTNTKNEDIEETFDPMTAMARIDEIQNQYQNTMFKWVEEFDRLFIEEGNI